MLIGARECVESSPSHRANEHRQTAVRGSASSGATASPSSAGIPGTRPTTSSSACAHVSAIWPASIDGSMMRCRHISNVKASQPYMVIRMSRSTLESRSPPSVVVDPVHDPVDLTLVVDVLDAAQHRIGACPCRRRPPTRRAGAARRSADTPARPRATVRRGLARHRRGVGRLEQPLALGLHHRGEERALVGEVVVHQRARHARPLGDLVDPDLVVGTFAEHLGAQRQQLVAPIVGGQPPSGFRHRAILICVDDAARSREASCEPIASRQISQSVSRSTRCRWRARHTSTHGGAIHRQ